MLRLFTTKSLAANFQQLLAAVAPRRHTDLSRSLDDNRDGQVHIVGVHQAHSYSSVAGKRSVHSIVSQHLQTHHAMRMNELKSELHLYRYHERILCRSHCLSSHYLTYMHILLA